MVKVTTSWDFCYLKPKAFLTNAFSQDYSNSNGSNSSSNSTAGLECKSI